jgi:hypothetical protein
LIGADARHLLDGLLAANEGILRLEPTWVARDFLPPGRRLGLPEEAYDVGERGFICERWLGSTTKADNRVGPADEGLSYLRDDHGGRLTLRDAVEADPVAVMGADYAAGHPGGLGRLAKLFDYGDRLPYHVHLPQQYASLVGCKSKDEAYLQDWDSDLILRHARAEKLVADEGFDIPSGVLHAPGTALTLELQEDSDVLAMFQALNAGRIISKDLLFKDVRAEDRAAHGEWFPLNFLDWELNGDPYFYENRHLTPRAVEGAEQAGGNEWWIFYNNRKFTGKKLVVRAGGTYTARNAGAHNVLVWSGTGTVGGQEVRGGEPGMDELFLVHDAATRPVPVTNTGVADLVIFTFFGPDINDDAPTIQP